MKLDCVSSLAHMLYENRKWKTSYDRFLKKFDQNPMWRSLLLLWMLCQYEIHSSGVKKIDSLTGQDQNFSSTQVISIKDLVNLVYRLQSGKNVVYNIFFGMPLPRYLIVL